LTPFWGSEKRSEKPSISPPENEAHDGVHLLPDLLVRGSGEAFQQGRLFFVESVESLPEIGALATKKIEQYVYQYDNIYIYVIYQVIIRFINMIICISVKAWATVQSFWMVINLMTLGT
jgi:hypothetical protein